MDKVSKNNNISYFDPNQIAGLTFDNSRDAVRVTLVGSDSITINGNGSSGEIKVINVPEIIREAEVHQVNVPVIIKEIEKIEIPVIVTEYKTIEVPVIIREVQVVEIEKPVITTEFKELSMFVKACMIIQCLATVGLLITHIMKGI